MPFHTIPHCSGMGQVFQVFHSVPPLWSTVEHLPLLQMLSFCSTTCVHASMHVGPSVSWGGVPQLSGEAECCGTCGTPPPFQNALEMPVPDNLAHIWPSKDGCHSVATARLKTAEPAEPSCFEPSQAGLLANDQIWLGLAHELGLAG